MVKWISMLVVMFLPVFSISCGNEQIDTSITISPPNGSIDQPVDVPVTATFSQDISEPLSWMQSFLLKKNDAGDNLCTDITYDHESQIVTCMHDDLEPGTSYTITITEILAVNGKQATFETAD